MDQFTFRVDLRYLDPFLSPEEQEKIAISKTTWIPGLNAGDNFVGRHGDVFSLCGASGIYLRDMIASQRVFGVFVVSIPTVQDLEVEDGDEIVVSWTSDDLYKTEVEYRFDGGSWSLYVADPGVSTMSIEVDGSMFEVRLRFTNGEGGYSNDYTTASIEIDTEEEDWDCEQSYSLLPIDQYVNGLEGACLLSAATSNESAIILVPDEQDQIGVVDFKLAVTPDIFQTDFEVFASPESETFGGKIVYYFGSPTNNPNSESLKYSITLDFTDGYVAYQHGPLDGYPIVSEGADLLAEEWLRVSVRFDTGTVYVRVNDVLIISYTDDEYESHPVDSEGDEHIGVAAITGEASAEFKIRNLLIEDVSGNDVNALTMFGLTEWDD
jgi:hypothetical protein